MHKDVNNVNSLPTVLYGEIYSFFILSDLIQLQKTCKEADRIMGDIFGSTAIKELGSLVEEKTQKQRVYLTTKKILFGLVNTAPYVALGFTIKKVIDSHFSWDALMSRWMNATQATTYPPYTDGCNSYYPARQYGELLPGCNAFPGLYFPDQLKEMCMPLLNNIFSVCTEFKYAGYTPLAILPLVILATHLYTNKYYKTMINTRTTCNQIPADLALELKAFAINRNESLKSLWSRYKKALIKQSLAKTNSYFPFFIKPNRETHEITLDIKHAPRDQYRSINNPLLIEPLLFSPKY